MPQLNLYLPKKEASELRARARSVGLSLSKYLASIARRELGKGWPQDYFQKVPGSWKGDLERPRQDPPQEREPL